MGITSEPGGLEWVERRPEYLALRIDLSLYPEEAIFRTCYTFTDRCYLFLERDGPGSLRVQFRPRRDSVSLDRVIGEFSNELINQRVRHTLAQETRAIRELIVAQALVEAPLDGK